jgi:hypothetical protein
MSKFEIGDKVRVETDPGDLLHGEVGMVMSYEDGYFGVKFPNVENPFISEYWLMDASELVPA